MKEIIDSIKAQIKERKVELAKLESALSKLEGDKPAPKAKQTSSAGSGDTASSSATKTSAEPLPERIIAYLASRGDDPGMGLTADAIASKLGLNDKVPQVRTTCSRLAREGRLASKKVGREAFYFALKADKPADDAANPFEAN